MPLPRVPTGAGLVTLLVLASGCVDGSGPGDTPSPGGPLRVAGGGHNVPDRYTSDLWVHGDHVYTGTWGGGKRNGNGGNVVKVWRLDATGAPVLADSLVLPGSANASVTDVEVSEDGAVLMFGREGGADAGLHLYSLADPERPLPLDFVPVPSGVHTCTFASIGDRRYAFAARNPPAPALQIYDVTDPADVTLATSMPMPANYGVHDTFVRDGIAFVFAWNSGVIIYDVGGGGRGGAPARPVELSRLVTSADGIAGGPAAHNGWWFHNPVSGERRYLFVGQEGPGVVGATSSGNIHVLDVADLTRPREVASFRMDDAGVHNFWMDEERQVLYAAYYNAGVVALDVSGPLEGNLVHRRLSAIQPGGADGTYTWGVQVAHGSVYASDMLTGLWQLMTD